MPTRRILVLGSTGYIGTRLVLRLANSGFRVRAGWRTKEKLERTSWSEDTRVEKARVDVLDLETLREATTDCDSVFYLVHSMYSGSEFAELDRQAAENMVSVAEESDVSRIVYLGGLGETDSKTSMHLQSRKEVADILQQGSVPTTVLRAAMIIGAGSASFEIMRYLVERLPVMTTPRWVRTKTQPIAISNVIRYLSGCLTSDETLGKTLDIGGPDIVTYRELMDIYARLAGLPKRIIIPIPILSPKLSSYWVGLVTPLSSRIAMPLVEGLSTETVCTNDEIKDYIPQRLVPVKYAIKRTIDEIDFVLTKQTPGTRPDRFIPEWTQPSDPDWAGGPVYIDYRKITAITTPERLWKPIVRIGGPTGWYYANWLWQLRGIVDEMIGGAGMRRGRTDCDNLECGDVVDCWRVVSVIENRYLKLTAEMWLPARSTLEFILREISEGVTELHQIIRYYPSGLFGPVYWNAFLPVHNHVWQKMLHEIVRSVAQ